MKQVLIAISLLMFAGFVQAEKKEPRVLDWMDLLTKEDRQKMAALPEIEHLGEEIELAPGEMSLNSLDFIKSDDMLDSGNSLDQGNPLDSGSSLSLGNPLDSQGSAMDGSDVDTQKAKQMWREVLTSTKTVAELNNTEVKISGFIVPLEFNDDMVVTEFFLVPYFGACIHVPPPPPNQLIYVTMEVGIVLDSIYDPFWVTGKLMTKGKMNDMGFAAYTLEASSVELYKEEM
ncbi:DUF3299 domain-containing protein [Porticoccaceae bacterium LTM1]|nr:DUF3299 domain-containing protein [Porticoccaceae bacterium LTM1]